MGIFFFETMQQRRCANHIANSAKLDDENISVYCIVVWTAIAMDAFLLMRFARNIAFKMAAIDFYNHILFLKALEINKDYRNPME